MANKRRNPKTEEGTPEKTATKRVQRVRCGDFALLVHRVGEAENQLGDLWKLLHDIEKAQVTSSQSASVMPGMVSHTPLPPLPAPRWDASSLSAPPPPPKAKFPIVVMPFASVSEIEQWAEKDRLLAALSHDCMQATGEGVDSFLQLSKHGQALLVYGAVTSGRGASGGTED